MVASRVVRATLVLTLAVAASACQHMNNAQNAVSEVFSPYSPTPTPKATATKVETIVPTSAPVLPVTVNKSEPVTLGQMSDDKKLPLSAPSAPMSTPAPSAAPVAIQESTPAATPSPVVASAPASSPAPSKALAAVKLDGKPLMVIRFNQNHVYYESALTKVIQTSERTKPNLVYNLVSVLPNISTLPADQQAKILSRSNENMRSVATLIQQLGVPADRIHVAKQEFPVKAQEIKIFVQ